MRVNLAVRGAARGGHLDIVNRFLTRDLTEGPRPDQIGVDLALEGAAGGGHEAVIIRLLTRDLQEGPRPCDASRDFWAPDEAITAGLRHIANLLWNWPQENPAGN